MEDTKHKFYLTASIKPEEETPELRKEVASVIKLPNEVEQQPDLSYFSAILVSTGTNLNGAHFLGSELVKASSTVNSKAVDIEHSESEIIGHIFSSAFTDEEHKSLDLQELASSETATLDSEDMHIEIGCVVYKSRFPEVSKEIAAGEWKVSMECYYQDFDVKVGDTIIPKQAAAACGIDIADDSIYGKSAKIVKDGKEVASGQLVRVLRGICFSGVGIVENPANPASVIVDTASVNTDNTLIIDMTEQASNEETINVTSKEVVLEDTTKDDAVSDNVAMVSDNGEPASSDQAELLSSVERVAAKCVDTLLQRKRFIEEGSSKLARLRNALDRASKTI